VCVANADLEDVVSALSSNPKLVKATGSHNSTALHWATLQGSHIANEIGDSEFYSNLLYFCRQSDYSSVISLLLDRGADINAVGDGGWTPLHLAAAYGKVEVVKLLVSRGAKLNAKDNQTRTPLDRAIENYRYDIVEYLESMQAETAKYQNKELVWSEATKIKSYSDNKISFSYPGDMRLMDTNEESASYSIIRPRDEFGISILCLSDDDAELIDSNIRRRSEIVDSLSKCEFLGDIVFGDNRGFGNCFRDSDRNGNFFAKSYDLLLKSNGHNVHITMSSIASAEDFDINDYFDILASIKVKAKK
jgi:hypothetical protein